MYINLYFSNFTKFVYLWITDYFNILSFQVTWFFFPHCSCPRIITAPRLGNSLPVFHHGQLYYLFRSPISGVTETFVCVFDFFQPASCCWEFSRLKHQQLINLYCLSVIQMADMLFFFNPFTDWKTFELFPKYNNYKQG